MFSPPVCLSKQDANKTDLICSVYVSNVKYDLESCGEDPIMQNLSSWTNIYGICSRCLVELFSLVYFLLPSFGCCLILEFQYHKGASIFYHPRVLKIKNRRRAVPNYLSRSNIALSRSRFSRLLHLSTPQSFSFSLHYSC